MKYFSFEFSTIFYIALIAYAAIILENYICPDTFAIGIGYLMLFTPFREENLNHWKKHVHFDTAVIYPPKPVPEILYKGKYSMITLRSMFFF
jgi:hypothetical protein